MINTIRADIYRLVRGKALYITFALMVLLVMIFVFTKAVVGVTVNMGDFDYWSRPDLTGSLAAKFFLTTTDNLVYYIIPLFFVVSTAMFTCGAIKNDLSTGMSRVKLYMSKWILSSGLCILLAVAYLILGVLTASLVNGFGDWTGAYLSGILRAFGAQMVVLLAMNSIGVFLSFVTRNTAMVIGIYFAVAFVPAILLTLILSEGFTQHTELLSFDLIMSMKLFSFMEDMSGAEIMRALIINASYMVLSTVGGILLFKRAEIK